MSEVVDNEPALAEKKDSETSIESPQRPNKDMKKQKKKKLAAFQSFLTEKTEASQVQPKRKLSGEEQIIEEKGEEEQLDCKICHLQLAEKRKVCQFCKDTVCLEHIRKKRKYRNTNKFARICDDCEDKYIYDKYMKLQMKAEESLNSQQMIIAAKHDELNELIGNKQVKIQLLYNKRKEFEQEKKANQAKYNAAYLEYTHKLKRYELKKLEVEDLGESLVKLESELPRPLEEDYDALLEQNSKITKELVKYQKLCNEAFKAASSREKAMYDEYYEWQKKMSLKHQNSQKKAEQCIIY